MGRLIIDGNRVYEVDEECLCRRNCEETQKQKKEKVILENRQKSDISGMNRKLSGTRAGNKENSI